MISLLVKVANVNGIQMGRLLINSQCQYHTFTLFLVMIIIVANMDYLFSAMC